MTHVLPELPYAKNALEPYISAETLEYHHDKHHAAYVKNLNGLIPDTKYEKMSLEEIVREAPAGGLFNNAAQVWNHTFYFAGMNPKGAREPDGDLMKAIEKAFGSFAKFQEEFAKSAAGNFGSGWTWLGKQKDGSLEIVNTPNAGSLITTDASPVLTIDVWEHAYYIDTRNARPKYIENWWKVVDWNVAGEHFAR